MAGIAIIDGFTVSAPNSIDLREGPHANLATALTAVTAPNRYQGQVIKILEGGQSVDYYFRDGTADANLIKKVSGGFRQELTFSSRLGFSQMVTIKGTKSLTLEYDSTQIAAVSIAVRKTASGSGTAYAQATNETDWEEWIAGISALGTGLTVPTSSEFSQTLVSVTTNPSWDGDISIIITEI